MSSDNSDRLDLDRGLPVTAADIAVQRRLRYAARLSFEDYIAFIQSLPAPSYEELRNRRGPCGEPFALPG